MKLKVGFDFHGVLDTHDKLAQLTHILFNNGHEVYVLTGARNNPDLAKRLDSLGVYYSYVFSIPDYLEQQGHQPSTTERQPYPTELWDHAKAEYAQRVGLDFVIDDSNSYGRYFPKNIPYLQVRRHES